MSITTRRPAAPSSRRSLLAGAGATALGLAIASCSGEAGAQASPHEVDIGFCTDMSFHHEQALAMCQRVLGRDTGGPVQSAAAEILQNQSYERGLMHARLQVWGESTAPPTRVMAWMGMEMPADSMPGLASEAQMQGLANLTGLAQGREFLELMRAHHVGGVEMAGAAATTAHVPEVAALASRLAAIQAYEIVLFDQLLAGTYADA